MAQDLTLLLVEDSELDADHAVRWLRNGGYTCHWERVDTPAALSQALDRQRFDLIICDYAMPAFSGLDALRLVRARDSETPFILLSGGMNDETALEALHAGATDVAFKDRYMRLTAIVGRALARAGDERDRRRIARALRMSEMRLSAMVASAMDAIISIDAAQRVVLFNAAAERMFGVAAADVLGQPLDRFLPAPSRAGHALDVAAFAATGVTTRRMGRLGLVSGVRADGTAFPIEASISQVDVDGEQVLTVMLRDISERVAAEAALTESHHALRALSTHLQTLREEERARLSREVHDQLGQALTAIKLEVTRLQRAGRPSPPDADFEPLLALADDTIGAVRRLASELRPAVLDLGLEAALEWQVREFAARTGLHGTLVTRLSQAVGAAATTACFRILQEGLTNIARHARASRFSVTVGQADGTTWLELTDDGVGIAADAARGPSLGLLGMRERAAALGGVLQVQAAPGGGTCLRVSLPIAAAPD